MKTTRFSVVMIALIAMISAASCSVEYRARHPRPKRVIVVGKADATEKINDNKADKKTGEAAIAVY